jgi:hypothetical protein
VLGGGRAEPLLLEGAGLDWVAPADVVGLVTELVAPVVVSDVVDDVVAEAFAPEVAALLLDATAAPDHQSFFARCDGEAFM